MKCPNCGEWMSRIIRANVTVELDGDEDFSETKADDEEGEKEATQLPVKESSETTGWTCDACGYEDER